MCIFKLICLIKTKTRKKPNTKESELISYAIDNPGESANYILQKFEKEDSFKNCKLPKPSSFSKWRRKATDDKKWYNDLVKAASDNPESKTVMFYKLIN